jgi:hypothetical protein
MIQSETRERFIVDLTDQLRNAEIIEAHFFAPRRVSGVERGVAVVAARQCADAPHAGAGPPGADAGGSIEALGELAVAAAADAAPAEADEEHAEPGVVDLDALAGSAAEDGTPAELPPVERYTVFTATYRHTLKGPDRGKWEVSVKAEADAPLVTVDQVVRGVQHRAEDTDQVERLTGDDIRAIVDAQQPAGG